MEKRSRKLWSTGACPFRGTRFIEIMGGGGHLHEVSLSRGIARVSPVYGMTVVAADFDNDGMARRLRSLRIHT